MRLSRCSFALLIPLGLACGGATAPVDDGSMHTWSLSPGPGHPEVELRLMMEGRAMVVVEGQPTGEIDVPYLDPERFDAPNQVLSQFDIDFDGAKDLQVYAADESGAYNHVYAWYRYDASSRSYQRCSALDGLHNVGTRPADERVLATSLGNGVGSSGVETIFVSHGGCEFEPVAEMRWDIGMSNGRGDASCTETGQSEPLWRMQVTEKPDRECP